MALPKKVILVVVAVLCSILGGVVAKADTTKDDTMLASYYSDTLEGRLTASGEVYKKDSYTAAHRTLPFGTVLDVCYHSCARVLINDRNPRSKAELDLSHAVADDIKLTPDGYGVVNTKEVRLD
jgi:rare lipoprotein A